MRKPVAILASAAILLAGCQRPTRSETWRKIVSAPRPATEAGDEARAYASELHKILLEARVPHKVVTFEFTYFGGVQRHGTGRRTVIVYRDASRGGSGWWLMDERLNAPVWLPDKPLESQISFYIARPATLIDVRDFMGIDRTKVILPPDQGKPRKSGTSKIERVKDSVPWNEVQPWESTSPLGKTPEKAPAPKTKAESKIVPVEKATPKATEKPAKPVPPKPKEEKPAEKKEAKPGEKPAEKPIEKATEKPDAKKDPKAEPPPIKSSEKTGKQDAPAAVKAQPGEKPAAKPSLFDKPDSTPQATIISEEKAPAPEPTDPPNLPDEKPKTSFLLRLFRRIFFRA